MWSVQGMGSEAPRESGVRGGCDVPHGSAPGLFLG